MVYNHMYMPLDYGRDPREDYEVRDVLRR